MDNNTPITDEITEDIPVLDIDTYRKFLSHISGVSPVDEADDMADDIADDEGNNPSDSATQAFIPNSIISYQCFTKAVNPDNLDTILKGFTPDDVFEPENAFVVGAIDAICPEFTKFSFVFDIEEEEGFSSYNMLKKALMSFDDARQDITKTNITEYVPFFFCELLSSDGTMKCNLCNPILIKFQRDIIDIIVPTSLVSFTIF